MKITAETKKKLIEDFNLDPKEPLEVRFTVAISENVENNEEIRIGDYVAYAGTFIESNGYTERKVVYSTEDIINFFSAYIKSVLE